MKYALPVEEGETRLGNCPRDSFRVERAKRRTGEASGWLPIEFNSINSISKKHQLLLFSNSSEKHDQKSKKLHSFDRFRLFVNSGLLERDLSLLSLPSLDTLQPLGNRPGNRQSCTI